MEILTARLLRETARLLREYASSIRSDCEGTSSFDEPKGTMRRQYRRAIKAAKRLERLARGPV